MPKYVGIPIIISNNLKLCILFYYVIFIIREMTITYFTAKFKMPHYLCGLISIFASVQSCRSTCHSSLLYKYIALKGTY